MVTITVCMIVDEREKNVHRQGTGVENTVSPPTNPSSLSEFGLACFCLPDDHIFRSRWGESTRS